MNPVVTARVPEGVRARGVDVLREIGSSTSELVNAAFEYVIKERKLPRPQPRTTDGADARALSPEQLSEVASFMERVKVDVPAQWDDTPFEELLEREMGQRYAHLR